MLRVVNRYGVASKDTKSLRAFVGISICSRFFSKSNVLEISKWCSENFDRFLILIADDPQTYTFMATKHLDFESASLKACQIGLERFNSITKWLHVAKIPNATILRWRDMASDSSFLSILDSVNICFKKNKSFCEDIYNQIQSRNSSLPGDLEFAKIRVQYFNIASQYVINEIAVMAYLQEYAKTSWPVQVFPLPMPTALTGLYEKKYCPAVSLHSDRSGYVQFQII